MINFDTTVTTISFSQLSIRSSGSRRKVVVEVIHEEAVLFFYYTCTPTNQRTTTANFVRFSQSIRPVKKRGSTKTINAPVFLWSEVREEEEEKEE